MLGQYAALELVFLRSDPRRSPVWVRIKTTTASAILVCVLLFLVAVGYWGAKSWSNRKWMEAMRRHALLKADLVRLRLDLADMRAALTSARETHDLAIIVFGLRPVDTAARQAGIGGPHIPFGLNGRIQELTRQVLFEMDAMRQTRTAAQRVLNRHMPNRAPVDGVITSRFGMRRHPLLNGRFFHRGIDISAAHGTLVKAPAAGWVVAVGYSLNAGRFVKVSHGFGYASIYKHLDRVLLAVGQRVSKGQPLAMLGNTGLSTGPHLHYEVLRAGRPLNPEPLLSKPGR